MKISKFTLIFLILSTILLNGCGDPPTQSLRLGTNVWPGYEPLYLAKHLEKWAPSDIKLIEYPSASEVLRAFRNKKLEAAALTIDEALYLRESNIPIKIFLVADISDGGDVILSKPEISEFNQLKGKVVGVESTALGAFVLSRALEINNMSLDDITIRHIDMDHHEQSYDNNKVDAIVTFDPVKTRLLNKKANIIFSSKQIPGEIVDVLVVHEEYLEKQKEKLNIITKGWFNALSYMDRHPIKAATIISERLKISPREVLSSYDGLKLPTLQDNRDLLGTDSYALFGPIKKLEKTMINQGLLSRETIHSPDLILTEQLLP